MASPRTLRDLSLRPVSVLKTVSERKAAQLELWGVETVLDLLMTFPRKGRYIDRTAKASVSGLDIGTAAAVLAEVVRVRGGGGGYNRNRKAPVTIVVRDETGTMEVAFFNQPWRAKQLREGTEAIFWGKVGDYRGTRQMVNPVVDVVAGVDDDVVGRQRRTLRILPVYPASAKAGLTSWEIGTFVEEALERAGEFSDPLAGEWLDRTGPVGPHGGHARHPRARVDRRDRTGPAAADLRRAVPPAAGPGAAPAGLRAQRTGAAPRCVPARSPAPSAAPWSRSSWARCRSS